jgi:hypothetical protein
MKKVFLILIVAFYSCSTSNSVSKTVRDGSTFENAIVIKASNEMDGVRNEYVIISKLYPEYKLLSQGSSSKGSKHYDSIKILTSEKVEKTIYFDITNFYGKF